MPGDIDPNRWPLWRSTRYTEAVPGSPEEVLARDASRTMRAIYTRWADRFQAVKDFVGWSEALAAPGGTKFISRKTPHRHPEAPFMVCTGCSRPMEGISFKGKGPADVLFGQVAKYEFAKIYLDYSTTRYDVVEDENTKGLGGQPDDGATFRYVTKLFNPGGKFLTIPRGHMKWADGVNANDVVTWELPRFIPEGELLLDWADVPTLPLQAILNCDGKLNGAAFAGFPAETLLMHPPRITPTMDPLGKRTWNIQYTFKWLPSRDNGGVDRGHNYVLKYLKDTKRLDYKLARSDGAVGGDALYATADFRTLFRPDQ